MRAFGLLFIFLVSQRFSVAQLFVARDTISVRENGLLLGMPWANGLNYCNVSNIDLDLDGKKDIVAFDKLNLFSIGRFRCFIKTGAAGTASYVSRPELSYAFPQVSGWAVFKDYNCDGKEDLFCYTAAGIKVYTNVSYTNIAAPPTLSFALAKPLLYTEYPGPVQSNLYAESIGVPGISDIDGDGDLDVLTFGPGSAPNIEYHKNLSKETYSVCDSLNKFQLVTYCWGNMHESNCTISLNQTCSPRPFPQGAGDDLRKRHGGACLTCIDSDGDGDKDLVLGDVSCNFVQYAHNNGNAVTASVSDSTMLYPNYPAKANTTVVRLNNFPCGFDVDVDGDNVRDLVVCPNTTGSENTQGMWYYRNVSLTPTVNFQFVKKTLFQDQMIDVGQNSFPVLFDENADGLKDLLIGTYGYYVNGGMKSQLTLYRNIGNASTPSFSLITRDYAGLSSFSLNCIMPAVGDVDGDGDTDLMVGTQSGQIYRLTNTAGPGLPCTFTFNATPLFTTPYAAAAPQLFDIDADGKLDLMIGGKNGRIMYYKNIGTLSNPSFSLVNNFFGSITVGNQNVFGIDGYAAPYFFHEGANTRLLVGSVSGQIYYYSVPSVNAACVLLDADANNINEGGQSSVFFEDLNGDNLRDLLVGNAAGGLSFFSSKGPDVGVAETKHAEALFQIFPNPAKHQLHIRIHSEVFLGGQLQLLDICGRSVLSTELSSKLEVIDISGVSPGLYLVKLSLNGAGAKSSVVKKLIIE